MRFAKLVFLIAGIYGIIVLAPQLFLEARTGQDYPPPITHPEYFYGFVGVGIAFQVVFLIISTDPLRYRNIMIPSVLEKAFFFIPALILFFQHRIPNPLMFFACIDLTLGILFTMAYLKTGPYTSHR